MVIHNGFFIITKYRWDEIKRCDPCDYAMCLYCFTKMNARIDEEDHEDSSDENESSASKSLSSEEGNNPRVF